MSGAWYGPIYFGAALLWWPLFAWRYHQSERQKGRWADVDESVAFAALLALGWPLFLLGLARARGIQLTERAMASGNVDDS